MAQEWEKNHIENILRQVMFYATLYFFSLYIYTSVQVISIVVLPVFISGFLNIIHIMLNSMSMTIRTSC